MTEVGAKTATNILLVTFKEAVRWFDDHTTSGQLALAVDDIQEFSEILKDNRKMLSKGERKACRRLLKKCVDYTVVHSYTYSS